MTSRPWSRYHRNRCVASNILSPRYLPTSMRCGVVMMLCSSAYRRMNGPRSSRIRRMFLNTGCISAKCSRNSSGMQMSHSIMPNTVPARTPLRICRDVIVHRACRRRGTLFYVRISSHLFPLAFTHLDDLDKVT